MKLEINSRKTQICEIRQHTLEQGMVKEEITERTKKYLVTNVNKIQRAKTYMMQQKQF